MELHSNNGDSSYISVVKRSSRRSSFPTLQGLYISLFESEVTNENLDYSIENQQCKKIDPKILKICFLSTILISTVLCLDHGFVACNLEYIEKNFGVGYAQSSFIGSMVYMGFLIGCLLTGLFLPILKSKILLINSLLLVTLSAIYSSKSTSLAEIYASRFFSGFFQAFSIVYLPLWVERYSPPSNTTIWLAYQQLFSMFGVFAGYLLGGILTCFTADEFNVMFYTTFSERFTSTLLSWRGPFIIQSILLIPIIILLIFIPSKFLDVGDEEHLKDYEYSKTTGLLVSGVNLSRSTNHGLIVDDVNLNRRSSKLKRSSILLLPSEINGTNSSRSEEIREICTNPIYLFTTVAVCGIYCFTTCIIFWLNQYLVEVINIDRFSSIFSVAFIYLTGPTLGVYTGGITGDLLNEYHPNGFGWILTFCTTFSFFGFILSIAITKTKSYITFVWGMILILFFLTSTLPMSLIVIIKCVPARVRQLASAIAQFSFNLVGFLLSPVLIGIIMDIIEYFPFGALKRKYNPIGVGIKIMLYVTLPIFFFYSLATFCSYCNCLISTKPSQKKIIISDKTTIPRQVIIH